MLAEYLSLVCATHKGRNRCICDGWRLENLGEDRAPAMGCCL
jgi:hypothetical protein